MSRKRSMITCHDWQRHAALQEPSMLSTGSQPNPGSGSVFDMASPPTLAGWFHCRSPLTAIGVTSPHRVVRMEFSGA